MQLKVYNTKAAEVGTLDLSDEVFGFEYNEPLIHQAVVAYLANQRQGTKKHFDSYGSQRGRREAVETERNGGVLVRAASALLSGRRAA